MTAAAEPFAPPPRDGGPPPLPGPPASRLGPRRRRPGRSIGCHLRAGGLPGRLPTGPHHRLRRPGPGRVLPDASRAATLTRHEIPADPDVDAVDAATAACREAGATVVVGVGGGGPLDAAKAVAAVAVNPGTAEEYQLGRTLGIPPSPLRRGAHHCWHRVGSQHGGRAPQPAPRRGAERPRAEDGAGRSRTRPPAARRPAADAAAARGLRRPGPRHRVLPVPRRHRLHPRPLFRGRAPGERGLAGTGGRSRRRGGCAGDAAGVLLRRDGPASGPGLAHVLAQPITAVTGIPTPRPIAALLPRTVAFNQEHRPGDDAYPALAALLEPSGTGTSPGPSAASSTRWALESICRVWGRSPSTSPPSCRPCIGSTAHIGGNPVRLDMATVEGVLAAALAAPPAR